MMRNLLRHETHPVTVWPRPRRLLIGPGVGLSPQRADSILWNLPRAVEGLAQHRIVGLLGNSTLTSFMEGGHVIFNETHHTLLRSASGRDGQEQVRVRHEVSIHLQQWTLLQDECGKNNLHTDKLFNVKCNSNIMQYWCDHGGGAHSKVSAQGPEFPATPLVVVVIRTRVRSIPSLSWDSRCRMTLLWSSNTPRSSSVLSSESITSSSGQITSIPSCSKHTHHIHDLTLLNLCSNIL